MAHHIGVLPADLLQVLSSHLDRNASSEDTHTFANGLRFVRLPHPRTEVPSLFLPYQLQNDGESVVLEVQAVSPPNLRSWFMSEEVFEDGKLLVMTSIDPAFLLIPLLRAIQPNKSLGNFRPAEDIIEDAANWLTSNTKEHDIPISSNDVLCLSSFRCIQAAMRRICDFKEITPEIVVFRYSPERVREYLRAKVTRLSHQGISEISRTLNRNLAKDGLLEDGKEKLLNLGRLRNACDLVSQYLPRDIYEQLLSSYDFTLLDDHLRILKEEAMAVAAMKMNAVEAKESMDSKEQNDVHNEKKRKGKGSTGVQKLKKANTRGMAKLSTFFQKK